jgi:HD-GYP domain-containing protein (c-di-GMP phosphodiesterase class II)
MIHVGETNMLVRKLMFSISTLEDLGKVLSSSEDFQVRLKTALYSIMGSLPVSKGGFFLHHPDGEKGDSIELMVTRGVDLAPGMTLPFPNAVKRGIMADRKSIFRHNPPHYMQEYLKDYHLIFDGLKTHLIQPLMFKKDFLGLICLGEKFNREEIKSSDLELLRIMGNYTSVSLHNQNLMINLEGTNVALRKKAMENAQLYADLQEMYKDTVRALGAAIDAKDPYTRGHSDRVANFSVCIALGMGLDQEDVNAINIAGHLHDIGKIAIDNTILCKPGKLDEQEFQNILRHPTISYDILSNIRFPYRDVALLARHHHEKLNGGGYPDKKKGEDLTMGMKILTLADSFDAMTSNRPYRPALTVEDALTEISRCVSVQFDRDVIWAFLRVLKDEIEGGVPANGIISNVGRKSDARHLGQVIDQMMNRLEMSAAH